MLQRPPRPRVTTTKPAFARRRLNVSATDSRASIAGLVTGPSRDLARSASAGSGPARGPSYLPRHLIFKELCLPGALPDRTVPRDERKVEWCHPSRRELVHGGYGVQSAQTCRKTSGRRRISTGSVVEPESSFLGYRGASIDD